MKASIHLPPPPPTSTHILQARLWGLRMLWLNRLNTLTRAQVNRINIKSNMKRHFINYDFSCANINHMVPSPTGTLASSHRKDKRFSNFILSLARCIWKKKTLIYYYICKNLMEFLILFSGLLLCLVEPRHLKWIYCMHAVSRVCNLELWKIISSFYRLWARMEWCDVL